MTMTNEKLNKANKNKKDEFYTRYSDVERELNNYKLQGKTILCNCNDMDGAFYRYFIRNFEKLNIKKIICTTYGSGAEKIIYDGNGTVKTTALKSGDFESEECLELLKESDVVVTNPPFSKFRQFVDLLMRYKKQFVIIGHQNAITYSSIFPHIKDNKIRLGYGFSGNVGFFTSPYEDVAVASQHKAGLIRVSGVMWFTNFDTDIKPRINLTHTYVPAKYPHYDNYNAIEVSKTKNIPCDYDGVMGVPITFMTKYNKAQFEIIGCSESEGNGLSNGLWTGGIKQPLVNGKKLYKRIFIRRRGK